MVGVVGVGRWRGQEYPTKLKMGEKELSPFSPTRHPTEFSAYGYLFGRFDSLVPVEPGRKVKGQLCLKQGITLSASVAPKVWQKLTHSGLLIATEKFCR